MAEDATLRDAIQSGEPAAAAAEPEKQAVAAKPALDLTADTQKEAAELGQMLLDSGFSKDQLPGLLQAPDALQSIQFMVKNDPAEFLRMLERTDPSAAKVFHEKMADIYVERYADKGQPAAGKGKESTTDPSLMQEIAALREKVTQSETREQQRENAAQLARLESGYRGRVDEAFNKIKEVTPLTKSEERALKAQLDADLAIDPLAKQRISRGNFADVPTKLNTIIRDWSADRKAAAESTKSRRDSQSGRASNEFQNGPAFDIPKDLNYADDDAFEAAFARALESAG